ncbi:AaceriAGR245Cp [[Ashbya] aceris (nom. inval.)]|nr:AaceriAGR245Cp [[Ashbya] aceris (nom. inval.)]
MGTNNTRSPAMVSSQDDAETPGVDMSDHKDLRQATQLLLDLKNEFMKDMNLEQGSSPGALKRYGHGIASDAGYSAFNCSRRTKERAERVKVYLEIYYLLLNKSVTRGETGPYAGVEGVYNPLQTIRNRKLRKTYKHYPSAIQVGSPIIAIKDFSRSSKPIPWFVDIYERSYDMAWRTSHWEKLRKPDGSYWFLQPQRGGISRGLSHEHGRFQRKQSSASGTSDVAEQDTAPLGSVPKHSGQDPIAEVPIESHVQRDRGFKKTFLSRLARSPPKTHGSSIESYDLATSDLSRPNVHSYNTPVDDTQRPDCRNVFEDVKIVNVKRNVSNSDIERSTEAASPVQIEIDPLLLTDRRQLTYLYCTWALVRQREQNLRRRQRILVEKSNIALQLCSDAENELPQHIHAMHVYEEALAAGFELCQRWKDRLLNTYSLRVDDLLQSSDRVMSSVNTTLTLRTKSLQELIDRLGISRYYPRPGVATLLYSALEFAIVALLWVIWFLFSILKAIRFLLYKLVALVTWLM